MGHYDRDKAKEAAYLINRAFLWSETPQGMKYWGDVYNNLMKESKEPVPKKAFCPKCGQEVKDAGSI